MSADNPISMNPLRPLRIRRRQRGTALIEFALVFPFLLVLTLCVIDMSRAFWIKNVATQAAREGVRYLVVTPLANQANVQNRVDDVTDAANVQLSQCTVTDLGGDQKQVTVGVQFNWLFPGLFGWLGSAYTNPMTLTASCVMRTEG